MSPSLEYESAALALGPVVGLDEVGRGALAGPVMVGAAVVTAIAPLPPGLNDSKLVRVDVREELADVIGTWAADVSVGEASAQEIDEWGLRVALAVAASRALDQLTVVPASALIDGPLNLLDPPLTFESLSAASHLTWRSLPATMVVKGDEICGSISAASIVAKVTRDKVMRALHDVESAYGWDENKGYGSLAHRQAIAANGPSVWHRQSWSLPARGADVH